MTTCKCRENKANIVMTRAWFDETLQNKIEQGVRQERHRVVNLLKGLPFTWLHGVQMIDPAKDEVIALIEGKDND
jgi:hypothetical protein